jgi:hypothetical protein
METGKPAIPADYRVKKSRVSRDYGKERHDLRLKYGLLWLCLWRMDHIGRARRLKHKQNQCVTAKDNLLAMTWGSSHFRAKDSGVSRNGAAPS